jgi:hypothetical protein
MSIEPNHPEEAEAQELTVEELETASGGIDREIPPGNADCICGPTG